MRRPIIPILLAFIAIISIAHAQISSRARTCCGLMNGKIYCYGGDLYSTATAHSPNSGMNVLDLTNSSGKLATDLQNMWHPVSYNINNVDLTSRIDPQCIVLEGGKQMIVNGGFDSTRPGQLTNLNIVYDVDKNQWNAMPDYEEPPYGRRQIYFGSATNIPGKGVAFYGGIERHINSSWSIPSTGNLSVFNFGNPEISRFVGYSQVAIFQYENKTNPWRLLAPLQNNVIATELSTSQTSIFDSVSNQIIFMGGGYRRNAPPSITRIPRPFDYISTVNVDNSHWQQLNPTGELPQPNRVYATTTLLPSTNRHVLLFGGEILNANVCLEYCFTLNLDTNMWKRHVIAAPSGTILQRSRHSAVLVDNDTLFIMWGKDTNNVGISSILILNVSNPDNIVLSNKYVDPNSPNADTDSKNNTATNDDGSGSSTEHAGSTGLSIGGKAGVAVACIVAAILGVVSIWLCFRNKKNKDKIRQQQQEIAAQQQYQEDYLNGRQQNDAVPMEVDWDRIENEYTEMPPIYTFQNNNANINDDHHYDSPTTINATTLVSSSPQSTAMRAVPPDGVELQNPHTVESTNNVYATLQPLNSASKQNDTTGSNHINV